MSSRRRPAAIALATVAVGLASVPMLTSSAQAATPVVSTKTLQCQTSSFTPYNWDAELTVTAQTDGTNTSLTMQANKLPGVVPLDVPSASTVGTIVAVVNGATVTLSGSGTTAITARQPVAVPAVSARIPGSATPLTIEVKRLQYDVSAFGSNFPTKCPSGGGDTSWPIGAVTVERVATIPDPTPTPTTPTPTATPTPTPSATPTKAPAAGAKKGVPAKGSAKFACKLQTLGSPFEYNPTVSVTGMRAKSGDSKVSLRADFSDIPGLAPLPIENGTMKINAEALIGGKKVSFASTSTINVPTKAPVPVPTQTATVTFKEDKMAVEITAFKFDFGQMAGTQIYSECTGGGKLSAMTVGIGALDKDDSGNSGSGSDSGSSSAAASGDTLPKTGSGAPLMAIGLWSSAFVLLAVALFLFLPRRNRQIDA